MIEEKKEAGEMPFLLPKDWNWIRLGDLVDNPKQDLVDGPFGSNLKSEEYIESGVPVFKIQNIKVNRFVDKRMSFVTAEKAKSLIRHSFQSGDLIITKLGEPLGLCCKVPEKYPFGIIVADLMRLRPSKSKVYDEYLINVINSDVVKRQFKSITKGTTRARVNLTIVRDIKVPSPPLKIQKVIVSKIEELFSELDKGIENLKTAQQQLKTYRQAVLKCAFEGKLTNKNVKEGELPKGWKWVTIKDIVSLLGDGLHGTPKYTENGDYYFINGNNLSNGKIVFKESTKRVSIEEYNKYKKILNEKSILVSINGTLGNIAFYNQEKVILGKSACYFNVLDCVDKNYLKFILNGQRFISYCHNTATGSTIPNVSLKAMREFEIPLPLIIEQRRIIQEIESRLSVADKMEESINQSLQQAEALKQSILKKAFEGKLVIEKKEEVFKPKNIYFYQMQVLGLIAKVSKKKEISHGEMTIAKYAYLADKIYNIPTHYDYNRWHLGPYPKEMKKAINNKQFFKIANYNIEVLNEEKLFKYENPFKDQLNNAVKELSEIFLKYKSKDRSHKTELLATVCKVIEDIKTIELKPVRQSMKEWKIKLANTVFKNKAEKFTEEETKKCLNFIVEKGWDNKLIQKQ